MMNAKSTFFSLLLCFLPVFGLAAEELASDSTPEQVQQPIGVRVETTLGSFVLELDPISAPETTANFLRYVDEGFYDNTLFHRVIPGFVIQGGGFDPAMNKKKTHEPVRNESLNGLKNLRGTISMARTSHPHSANSQFFINVTNNDSLDASARRFGYAVFGKVTRGMETVDKIVSVPTTRKGMYSDVPAAPVLIIQMKRQPAEEPARVGDAPLENSAENPTPATAQ